MYVCYVSTTFPFSLHVSWMRSMVVGLIFTVYLALFTTIMHVLPGTIRQD